MNSASSSFSSSLMIPVLENTKPECGQQQSHSENTQMERKNCVFYLERASFSFCFSNRDSERITDLSKVTAIWWRTWYPSSCVIRESKPSTPQARGLRGERQHNLTLGGPGTQGTGVRLSPLALLLDGGTWTQACGRLEGKSFHLECSLKLWNLEVSF